MGIQVVDFRESQAPALFVESLLETGFAVLTHHPIESGRIDRVYQQWQDFFNSDEKYRYPFDANTHAGFVCAKKSETAKGHCQKDLKEFFHYYHHLNCCPNKLYESTSTLYCRMQELAILLLQWIQAHTPESVSRLFSMPLSSMIAESTKTLLRIIHYPPITQTVPTGAIRAGAHEDIDLLTLLPAATAKGLQVQLKTGQWVDVPCEKGWLIVNIGDMLSECSGGYYRATPHRVINPDQEQARHARVSCPLFLHPRQEVRLSVRHTAASYWAQRVEQLGLL